MSDTDTIEARLERLERDVAAIKRLRMIKANLNAQEAEDGLNGNAVSQKAVRPQSNKAVLPQENK